MGLTRKFLKDLGLESEQIEKIINEHTEVVTAIKEDLDTSNSKIKTLEKSAKEAVDLNNYVEKEKYTELETVYNTFKTEVAGKETLAKKQSLVKENVLKELKINEKIYAKVLKDIDFTKIELNEKGEIKEIDTLKNSIKNDWGDFITTENVSGAKTPTPPVINKNETITKEEFAKMGYNARVNLKNTNPDAYKELVNNN
ncbi:MAG: hypothetical protein RR523_15655 [Cetobacterium sp.]